MSKVRIARIHAIRSGNPGSPKGAANSEANLRAWSNRASKNSYHGPSSEESGTDPRLGRQDLNHGGSGDYLPKVRRDG